MPAPKPNKNEEKDKYMSRCIPFYMDEGKPQKQAIAICYSLWDKSIGEEKMSVIDKIDKYLNEKDNPEKAKVLKLLIKHGNNKDDSKKMVDKHFDYVKRVYPDATPRKMAEVIRSIH